MRSPVRLALVTNPAHAAAVPSGQGTLDGEAVAERLRQGDLAFEVQVLDPADDVAGQIEDRLQLEPEPDLVVLYASAPVLVDDGELLLCLDPGEPSTGDALEDVLEALLEGFDGAVLVLADLRVPVGSDSLAAAEVAATARTLVKDLGDGRVELLLAVRATDESGAESPSPFTRGLLEALDDVEPEAGLTGEGLHHRLDESGALLRDGVAFTRVGGETSPWLVEPEAPVAPPPAPEEDAAPPEEEDEVEDHADDAPAVTREAASPKPPVVAPAAEPKGASVPAPAPSRPPSPLSEPPPSLRGLSQPPPPSLRGAAPTAQGELAVGDERAARGDDEGALAYFRRALALVGTAPGGALVPEAFRASVHARIGELLVRQGKPNEAVAALDKALGLGLDAATTDRALRLLLGLHLGARDFRAAANVQQRILERSADVSERVGALVAFAEAWLGDAGERMRARAMLEEAATLAPEDARVLRPLLAMAQDEGRVDDAIVLRKRLAGLEGDPEVRSRDLTALGKELAGSNRDDDALEILEAALDAAPGELEPLDALASILAEQQEWSELEGVYRRMLDRAPRISPASLRRRIVGDVAERLGGLLRDHLADVEGALDAMQLAVSARPRDMALRLTAAELAFSMGNGEHARSHFEVVLGSDARCLPALHALFDLSMRADRQERAADLAAVLVWLDAATDRERLVHEAQRREATRPSGTLPQGAWEELRGGRLEGVARVFATSSSATLAALVDTAKKANRLPALDASKRVDLEATTISSPRALGWAARVLGLPAPDVFVDEAAPAAFAPVLRVRPTTLVGGAALRGRSLEELSFLAGHHLATHLPEHRVTGLAASADDLTAYLLAAVRVVAPKVTIPAEHQAMVTPLARKIVMCLDPADQERLERAAIRFGDEGGTVDVEAWAVAVERAALGAGLLLSGDLAASMRCLPLLPKGALDEAARAETLLEFAVSEAFGVLRTLLRA